MKKLFFMSPETKDRIASRFLEKAWQHMLVRALLFSVGFRICFIAFLLLPVVAVLCFTKIWRVTPDGFAPVIRINVLDWLQARALEKTAIRELRAGKIQDGIISYNMAAANNPGNVPLLRGLLQQIHEKVNPPEFQLAALHRTFWLLRLTGTNVVNLELAATIFEQYGLDQYLISLLTPRQTQLTPPLQKAYLRALFNNDRMAEFDRVWHSLEPSSALRNDPELQLFRAAFAEGWGTSDLAGKTSARLEDYVDRGNWQTLANRLYLRVCLQRNEVEPYLEALGRLQKQGQDRLLDHVRSWRLLHANRRQSEARDLAQAFAGAPATGLETVELARTFHELGMPTRAAKLLDESVLEFSFLDGLWILYANLLIETERWDELRKLALRIRLRPDVADRLRAYSYFLEGRVEIAQNRPGVAAQLFAQIPGCPTDNLELALNIANGLVQLGQPRIARALLETRDEAGRLHPGYWQSLVTVAFALKDETLLLRAATEAVSLSPTSWPVRNNYAAALVITQRSPGDAIKETFPLASQFPQMGSIRINHALALLQNHRAADADRLLAGLIPSALTESERAVYYFACFETLITQQRFALARQFSAEIDSDHLFPTQQEQLKHLRQILDGATDPEPARVAATP